MAKFNPNDHLTKLKGKDYLEVKWRMVWFREEWPEGTITTESLELTDKRAVFRATVTKVDNDGVVRGQATGTKSETPQGFADYIEKAETGAIGRALAALGFGTQFAPELEEGERIVDSPVQRKPPATPTPITLATQRDLAALHAAAAEASISHDQLHAWAAWKGLASLRDVASSDVKNLARSLKDRDNAARFIEKFPEVRNGTE